MRFLLYAAALLVMIAGDQALKGWTVSHLELGESTPFIPAIMQLTRVHNYGAAWSSLSGKTVLLIAVTAVMMIAVAVLLIRRVVRHPLGVAACLLILGGGIGNIIDRIRLGYVVDMFDLLLFSYPVFNLADCFVVVGAILGAVYYLWIYEKFDARKKSNDSPSDSHN
ncbi:MAG: signal peptidase II [Oscillospiraceae bacterium]|nr:signal peptidase II [Oscillospiraceae bacterium]